MNYKPLTQADMAKLEVGSTLHVALKVKTLPVFVNIARVIGRWPIDRSKPWTWLVVDVGGTAIRFDRQNHCTTNGFGSDTKLVRES